MDKFNEVYTKIITESNKNKIIKESMTNNENKTITDKKGRIVKINEKMKYSIIYIDDFNGNKIKVSQSCYKNYPGDPYIGHDDEGGSGHGPRFFFDQATSDDLEYAHTYPVLKVMTDEEFINILKNL